MYEIVIWFPFIQYFFRLQFSFVIENRNLFNQKIVSDFLNSFFSFFFLPTTFVHWLKLNYICRFFYIDLVCKAVYFVVCSFRLAISESYMHYWIENRIMIDFNKPKKKMHPFLVRFLWFGYFFDDCFSQTFFDEYFTLKNSYLNIQQLEMSNC